MLLEKQQCFYEIEFLTDILYTRSHKWKEKKKREGKEEKYELLFI